MASEKVLTFGDNNFDSEVLQAGTPVLVDFWATWCAPCKAIAPTIDAVAEEYDGKVKVGKVNVDDNQDLAMQYGITSIPRVLLFKGGQQPRQQLIGLQREADITKLVDQLLAS